MSWRRNLMLGVVATGVTAVGFMAANGLAQARQNAPVCTRFLVGYLDASDRFVPTAGRGATNVDRNALLMFQFSGAMGLGNKLRASLPLTLDEQGVLAAAQAADPDFDLEENGYEPGSIPRKLSTDRAAFYVATGSVTTSSVAIAAPQIGGSVSQAPGQYFMFVNGKKAKPVTNRLLFNPRYTVSTFNQPQQIDYNPQGLDGGTVYNVLIDGGSFPSHPFDVLRNADGVPMAVVFSTSFKTTNSYVQDYNRPQVRSASPADGSTGIQSDADIELSFSEPMNLATFVPPRFQGDDQWTVIARYTTNPKNGTFVGQNLLVSVRVKPQTGGDVVQVRPLQGFGVGPYEIECIVRNGVTDLSGNNITRQQQVTFTTAYNPNADKAGLVQETFDTNTKQDTTFGSSGDQPAGDDLVAFWNNVPTLPAPTQGIPKFLAGRLNLVTFVAWDNPIAANQAGVNIFQASPFRTQNLYTAANMGGRPRSISGFNWYSTSFTGLTYPNTSVKMGHANELIAGSGFPVNANPASGNAVAAPGPSDSYFADTPVLVAPQQIYKLVKVGNYVTGPTFSSNFAFDGIDSVILDMTHGGNGTNPRIDERWLVDIHYAIPSCTFLNMDTNQTYAGPGGATWYFNTQFTYMTPGAEAQSKFYDLGRDDARILPQQIVPTTQPQGTAITFQWQGAKSDVLNPLNPDLTTLTPWIADVRSLSTYRYIRFRVTLFNNVSTKAIPSIDTLLIPFTYK